MRRYSFIFFNRKDPDLQTDDGERSHGVLMRKLGLTEEFYKTAYTINLKDEDNPLDPINRLHALAKRFMKSHGGYNRDNLQDSYEPYMVYII